MWEQFEIEHYEVATKSRADGHTRTIILVSTVLAHGIQHRATLFFYPVGIPQWLSDLGFIGVALNVGQPNFDGIDLRAFFRPDTFAEVYDILRNEKPVFLDYFLTDVTGAAPGVKAVRDGQVSTGTEWPGEGPVDAGQAPPGMSP